ncbi:MAG: ergosterol biosynthesis protein [Cirrosporium novae-zelandiae]|nr:MAG: ergosterol biosynthesis protein [Cirrosporium novae-zelandiae]
MDSLLSHMPPHEGLLPQWLLFVCCPPDSFSQLLITYKDKQIAVTSAGNSIQSYLTLTYTRQVYLGSGATGNKSPATPLSSRTFGTWTFLSAVIRYFGAYYIDDPVVYTIVMWSYVIALFHFASEWLIFGSARMGKGLLGPAIVSTCSLFWMYTQKAFYLGV